MCLSRARRRPWLIIALLLGTFACGDRDRSLAEGYCDLEIRCDDYWSSHDSCTEDFHSELVWAAQVSVECHEAMRRLITCMAELKNCEELEAYWTEPVRNYPCYQDDDAVDAACSG
jgi:hypothetical protein